MHGDWETLQLMNGNSANSTYWQNRKRSHSLPSATGSRSKHESYQIKRHELNPGSQAVERTHTSRQGTDLHSIKDKGSSTAEIRAALQIGHDLPRENLYTVHGARITTGRTDTPPRTVNGSRRPVPQLNGQYLADKESVFYALMEDIC